MDKVFVSDSNVCIKIIFGTFQECSFRDTTIFNPLFTNQIINDEELIHGYSSLQIFLYFHPYTLDVLLKTSYSDSLEIKDDISDMISSKFTQNIYHDELSFKEACDKYPFSKPFGTMIHSYIKDGSLYSIYTSCLSSADIIKYHRKFEIFFIMFIDGASRIDNDNKNWNVFYIFEEADNIFQIVGAATVYTFFKYPDYIRPRISQFLILPPYQTKGHGSTLLKTILSFYRQNNKVYDITVEDPTDDFNQLRNYVDCEQCLSIGVFGNINIGFSLNSEIIENIRKITKLNRKQIMKVYEILLLKYIDRFKDMDKYNSYIMNKYGKVCENYRKRLNVLKRSKSIDYKHCLLQYYKMKSELEKCLKNIVFSNLEILQKLRSFVKK